MGSVNNNPDDLHNFINVLNNYISTLDDETTRMSRAYEYLRNIWRDEKEAQFGENLAALRNQIAKLEDDAKNVYIPLLSKLEQDLRNYISRR